MYMYACHQMLMYVDNLFYQGNEKLDRWKGMGINEEWTNCLHRNIYNRKFWN